MKTKTSTEEREEITRSVYVGGTHSERLTSTLSDKIFRDDENTTNLIDTDDIIATNKKILERIETLITKEEFCMVQDMYSEQEIEHINQIEMANKIKEIIKSEMGKELI